MDINPVYNMESLLSTPQIIKIVRNMLAAIDSRLMHHGEQVAWIARKIAEAGHLENRFDMQKLFLLSLLHDVGAYRTEETDQIVHFESINVKNHALYGYLFLKYLTPLADSAEAVRYHHTPYSIMKNSDSPWREYASLIFFADRVAILMLTSNGKAESSKLASLVPQTLSPEYYTLFCNINAHHEIEQQIAQETYITDIDEISEQLDYSSADAFQFLKMMVYLLDFHSTATVNHMINTAAFASSLGKKMDCTEKEQAELFTAALLHDIGKFGIPVNILESPGKLDKVQIKIMQTHVIKTEKMIRGIVPDKIVDIAVRHHERLNGTGYPNHLTATDLTVQQRILAIADILSALTGTRSYKTSFSKEKTLRLLNSMVESGGLDPIVNRAITSDYDMIIKDADKNRQPLISVFGKIKHNFQKLSEQKRKLS